MILPLLLLACSDSSVTKNNASPEASISAPADGAVVGEGDAVTWTGVAGDPDDDASTLTATWYLGDTVLCAASAPSADGTTQCAWTADPDLSTVSLEVRDPSGASATVTRSVVVTPNEAPVAQIVAPSDGALWYSDQLLLLEGRVTDDGDDPLDVSWTSSVDGELARPVPDADGSTLDAVYLSAGQHLLTLAATDAGGARGTDAIQVEIRGPNSAPSCAITAPADGHVQELGSTLVLEGTVGDADEPADGLSVVWSSDRDGTLGTPTASSAGEIALAVELSAGTHVVTLSAADELGTTCADLVVLTIGARPTVEILSPGEGDVVNEGQPLSLAGMVSDAEDPEASLGVTWTSDLDGVLDTSAPGADGSVTAVATGLTVGDHVIALDVTDGAGLTASDLVHVRVNGLPAAPGIALSPASPSTTDDLTATLASASVDPEGDAVGYRWDWYVDGVWSGASSSAVLPASATRRGEVWEVVATPYDPFGDGAPARASVTIVNSAPSVDGVTLTPPSPSVGVAVTCAVVGSDLDGDPLAATYAWSVDGRAVATGATLDGSFVRSGAVLTCDATVSDGAESATGSASATVLDTPPEVLSVVLSPDPVATTGWLTCAATATDADGDALTLRTTWTSSAGSFDDAASLSASRFTPGDAVYCTVTPAAGGVEGSALSSNVVRVNQPPTVGASLSPGSAAAGDVVSCLATASDPDGGSPTLTYAWTRDGVAAGTGASLAATRRGEVLVCTVTASDGLDSATADARLTVVNSAPEAPVVSVTPATSDVGAADLTCVVTTPAVDPDGDTVAYTFAWTVDGSAWSGATTTTWPGDTVPAADTSEGIWECTATPDDGLDDGPSASASALVESGVSVWVDVSAGGQYACAIDDDAQLSCWGTTAYIGTLPGGDWAKVEVGIYDACGLHTDGTIECWGAVGHVETPGTDTYTDLEVQTYHACGLATDGTIDCWGASGGDRDFGQITGGPSADYIDVGTGYYNSCGVRSSGQVECWGRETATEPTATNYLTVTGGLGFNCALDSGGDVDCWGETNVRNADAPSSGVVELSGGYMHACALLSTGAIDCFGTPQNDNGQQADPSGTDWVDVSAGGWVTVAIDADGQLTAWGQAGSIVSDLP